jgi:hypothetical protein
LTKIEILGAYPLCTALPFFFAFLTPLSTY